MSFAENERRIESKERERTSYSKEQGEEFDWKKKAIFLEAELLRINKHFETEREQYL